MTDDEPHDAIAADPRAKALADQVAYDGRTFEVLAAAGRANRKAELLLTCKEALTGV